MVIFGPKASGFLELFKNRISLKRGSASGGQIDYLRGQIGRLLRGQNWLFWWERLQGLFLGTDSAAFDSMVYRQIRVVVSWRLCQIG